MIRQSVGHVTSFADEPGMRSGSFGAEPGEETRIPRESSTAPELGESSPDVSGNPEDEREGTGHSAPFTDAASPLSLYLRDIGPKPLLKADEEIALAQAIERGREAAARLQQSNLSSEGRDRLRAMVEEGNRAHRRLVESNLRLVVSIARRYAGRGLALDDLIQEGNIGLSRAVDRFDWHRGFRFSTYATWWIRQAITRAIADQGRTIRLPVHIVEATSRVVAIAQRLVQELGRDPTPDEIARAAALSPEHVRQIYRSLPEPVSLATLVGEESELGELLPDLSTAAPAEIVGENLLHEQIATLLDELEPREQIVIGKRFGLSDGREYTLEEVGRELGVTRERVRQIEASALRKLRLKAQRNALREYLHS